MTDALRESILHMSKFSLWILCAITCAICVAIAFAYVPEDWSILRTTAAGIVSGMWCFMCIFANRVMIA